MPSYYLKWRKNTESIIPRVFRKANNGKTMMLSKCAICGGKKSRFVLKKSKKQVEY